MPAPNPAVCPCKQDSLSLSLPLGRTMGFLRNRGRGSVSATPTLSRSKKRDFKSGISTCFARATTSIISDGVFRRKSPRRCQPAFPARMQVDSGRAVSQPLIRALPQQVAAAGAPNSPVGYASLLSESRAQKFTRAVIARNRKEVGGWEGDL
jgi:hypothetical protein